MMPGRKIERALSRKDAEGVHEKNSDGGSGEETVLVGSDRQVLRW
jgi:hypothetical protein